MFKELFGCVVFYLCVDVDGIVLISNVWYVSGYFGFMLLEYKLYIDGVFFDILE